MIKLIATDVDGTLVKDGTLLIDPEYMTVVSRLVDQGIHFVVCSGRQFSSEQKLFAPIKDRLLYISDGGTVVRTPEKILKTYPMETALWKSMCRMVHDELPSCDCFAATPGLLPRRRCRKPHVSLAPRLLRLRCPRSTGSVEGRKRGHYQIHDLPSNLL